MRESTHTLCASDTAALLRTVKTLYARTDARTFGADVLEEVRRLVGGDIMGFSEIDVAHNSVVEVLNPVDATRMELEARLAELAQQHPLMVHFGATRDTRARTISDFLSHEDFVNSQLYSDVYRPYGGKDQIAVMLPTPPPLAVYVVINRDRRSFTNRDRRILELLSPHLARARANAEAVSTLDLQLRLASGDTQAIREGIITPGPRDTIQFANRRARELLTAYFPRWPKSPARLPEPIARWAARQTGSLQPAHLDSPPSPLSVQGGPNARLQVRLLPPLDDPARPVLLVDEIRTAPPARAAKNADVLGVRLSPRLKQVLDQLLTGAAEKHVAASLGISKHTTHDYVTDLYRRFAVTSRAELLARFVR
jgi:DNA-binding CsgD family transcriptional regulator